MPRLIQDRLVRSAAVDACLDDERLLEAALRFEAALARAGATAGLVPAAAAAAIEAACAPNLVAAETIAAEAALAGTLAIPLVRHLTDRVAATAPDAARFVHLGGTSQDLADTAFVLCLKVALAPLRTDLSRLARAAAGLALTERDTLLPGRTLLQPALPIPFGLKAAQWLLGIEEAAARLELEARTALVLQFGGAAGTLASLGTAGLRLSDALARELGLPLPAAPWHSRRGNLAGLGSALAILTGASGKIARDLSLLMQPELGEASEPIQPGRGGSSAMPHKRNPILCQRALTAASRAPGLAATLLSNVAQQEHERGLAGWQADPATLGELASLAHDAVASMADALEGLLLDHTAMRRNLDALRGLPLSERLAAALSPALGRPKAMAKVERLVVAALSLGRPLAEATARDPETAAILDADALRDLFEPSSYLGSAHAFIDRALAVHHAAEEDRRAARPLA